ncbi:MAG: hypothetical protein R3C24_10775 [Cyanobacteriota/Melainabacteria group bacterium]
MHSYGHGGSGITTCPGVVLQAVSLMEKHDATDSNAHSVPAPLDKILNGIEI